jgi:hypothetical protein
MQKKSNGATLSTAGNPCPLLKPPLRLRPTYPAPVVMPWAGVQAVLVWTGGEETRIMVR